MYENIQALRSFLALSLIDKNFHNDELSFITDIAEEELELSKQDIIKEQKTLEYLSKKDLEKIFNEFVDLVPEREKNYFFDLYSRLSIIDAYLHEDEVEILSNLEKKWNILKSNSKAIKLDKIQKDIVETNKSERLLVIAPPWCGKTAVAAERCLNLAKVQNVQTSKMLVLSFSRNAVKEFRDRIETKSDLKTEPHKVINY